MSRYLIDAESELKRAEHLIHVSLKYTRTVDVIKSIIDRLINCYDMCMLAMLEELEEKKKLETIPKSPGLRAKILEQYYKDQIELVEFINFYRLLRRLSRAEFQRSQEYRRNVTMTAFLQEGPMEINIDIITSFYKRTKIFFRFIAKYLFDKQEQTFEELLRQATVEVEFEGI